LNRFTFNCQLTFSRINSTQRINLIIAITCLAEIQNTKASVAPPLCTNAVIGTHAVVVERTRAIVTKYYERRQRQGERTFHHFDGQDDDNDGGDDDDDDVFTIIIIRVITAVGTRYIRTRINIRAYYVYMYIILNYYYYYYCCKSAGERLRGGQWWRW
jgi:hypothetical protein